MSPIRVGFEIDPKVSWMSPSYVNIKREGVVFGTGAGVFIDYFFQDNFALTAGISYNPMSSLIHVHDTTSYAIESTRYKMHYVGIPVTGKILTDDIAKNLKVLAEVGLLVEYNLSSEYTMERNRIPGMQQSRPLNLSILMAVGTEYFLNRRSSIMMELSYARGLNNVLYTDEIADVTGALSGGTVKYNAFSLRIGYVYIFNRRSR